jgi:hypothetical protein
MDPDQTARMRRLVWIYAGRKPIVGFVVTRLKCNEFIVVKYNVVGGLQFMYFFYKV